MDSNKADPDTQADVDILILDYLTCLTIETILSERISEREGHESQWDTGWLLNSVNSKPNILLERYWACLTECQQLSGPSYHRTESSPSPKIYPPSYRSSHLPATSSFDIPITREMIAPGICCPWTTNTSPVITKHPQNQTTEYEYPKYKLSPPPLLTRLTNPTRRTRPVLKAPSWTGTTT